MVKKIDDQKVISEESDVATSKSGYKILVIEGTKYRTNFHRKHETKGEWVALNLKEIAAFIPGTIIKINVKPGQQVKHGDLLVIFEAMKMHNQLKAPFDGVIKEVNAKVGDKVVKGFKIIEFE
jgi:acetyl/propionyl-CoA carboxylase alpha subunit